MLNLSKTYKQMMLCMIGVSLLAFGVAVFFVDNPLFLGVGVCIGVLLSGIKLFLLEKTIEKSLNMQPKDATNFVRLNYTFRYFLTGIILGFSVYYQFILFIGVVLGLFSMQISAYLVSLVFKQNS